MISCHTTLINAIKSLPGHEHQEANKTRVLEIDKRLSEFYVWSKFLILHQHINQLTLSVLISEVWQRWTPPPGAQADGRRRSPPGTAVSTPDLVELSVRAEMVPVDHLLSPASSSQGPEREQAGRSCPAEPWPSPERDRDTGIWDVHHHHELRWMVGNIYFTQISADFQKKPWHPSFPLDSLKHCCL